MPKVLIDDIDYVPRASIPPLTDDRLEDAVRQLVVILYLEQTHKAMAHVLEVLRTLAPDVADLATLDTRAAYERMHPEGLDGSGASVRRP